MTMLIHPAVTMNTKADVADFINVAHNNNAFVYKCIGFKGVLSIKDSKLKVLHNEIETKIGYVGARPHMKAKRIGLNRYEIEVDNSACPNAVCGNVLTDLEKVGKLNAHNFWDHVVNVNKGKLLTFQHYFEIDSPFAESTGSTHTSSKMTDEWRVAIGNGHRGMKYKTKALEGITWKWGTIGKRKVKLLIG